MTHILTQDEIRATNARIAAFAPAKVKIGHSEFNAKPVYLSRPTIDCGWYWGFGYVGNNDLHMHLNTLGGTRENLNLYDHIEKHIPEFIITNSSDMWKFCDIVQSIYTLRTTSELVFRGGSNYTTNPGKDALHDPDMYRRIMLEMIPSQLEHMYAVLMKYARKPKA